MGNWTWDQIAALVCLFAAVGFAAVLLLNTIREKAKLIPGLGLVCSLLLLAGIVLTAQLPNLMGGGIKPDPASSPSSAPAATKPAAAQPPVSSQERIAQAETYLQAAASKTAVKMTGAESRFQQETGGSSAPQSSAAASVPPTSSAASPSGIRILRAPGTVARGQTAQLTIQGLPNTAYTIQVVYDSGNITGAKSTRMRVGSDTMGRASWAWTIGSDIAPGAHFITITGGGKTLTTSFTTSA